ncbi:MAG TPA: hypothetical protein VFZ61_06470 [Polyangiales bacterium]
MKQRRYHGASGLTRRRLRTWLAAATVAGFLAGLWIWLYASHAPKLASAAAATGAEDRAEGHPVSSKRARTRAQLQLLAQLARAAQQPGEPEPARVPHPITDDHRRLYRDVDLLHAAEEAIEQEHFDEARALLLTHQRELPGMSPLEAEGLWLLVDCVERPSATNTARVQTFYDEHTSSTVRRRLRRSCLERGH